MVRHEVAVAMRAHGHVCAVELLCAVDVTPAVWRLLAEECESLGSKRHHYRASLLRGVCALMARGDADAAVEGFATECGLTVEEWATETRREMAAEVSL